MSTTVQRIESIPLGERTAFGRAPCCCCCPVDAVVRVTRLYDYAAVHGMRVAAERLAFCRVHTPAERDDGELMPRHLAGELAHEAGRKLSA